MRMRFLYPVGYEDVKWVKDTLHFTNKRLIWNIKDKGIFSQKVTFDDMPYKAIRAIDKTGEKHWLSEGGLLVMSVVGNHEFQFNNEDTLKRLSAF